MVEPQSDSQIRFSLSLSVDRDRFLRRNCPSCGRDFKTEANEADLAWVVAPQIRRMGLEIGANPDAETVTEDAERLYCPYCEHCAEIGEMLTEELVRYLHRHMMREVVLPMTKDLFSGLENTGSRSGSFISIRVEQHRSLYPPRPIHGPELPDMKIIEFLCCGKKAKVTDRWYMVNKCVYCGTPVQLV